MDNNEKEVLETKEVNESLEENMDNVTREINLDDLYDGAINNTVMLDPITKDEVLIENKKSSYTIIGIVFAILVLLSLYYLYNKTNLGGTVKDVEPVTTTTEKVVVEEEKTTKTGTLSCSYTIKSDNESQVINYSANFIDDKISDSLFNYVVISNTELTETSVTQTLINEYERFYLENSNILGTNLIFEKNEKGFTFNLNLDYKNINVDSLTFPENETVYLVKPSSLDTYDIVKTAYENNGYTCSIVTEE